MVPVPKTARFIPNIVQMKFNGIKTNASFVSLPMSSAAALDLVTFRDSKQAEFKV